MKKFIMVMIFAAACLIFPGSSTGEDADVIKMSLQNCLVRALENNLDIAVASYDPEISNVSVQKAGDKYFPQLSLNYLSTNQTVPSTWGLEGNEYKSIYNYFGLNISQSFVTGGTLNFRLFNRASDTTRAFTNVNPSYFNEISFEFSQPLLRGFGPRISNHELNKAKNSKEISVFGVRTTIQQKIFEIEEAYWNLVHQRENLKVQFLSLEQNKIQLKKVREAAKWGVKSSIDVLQMETEEARWEDGILNSQSMVEVYEDRLKNIMNIRTEDPSSTQAIVPTDSPVFKENKIPYKSALRASFDNRPEIASTLKRLKNNRMDVKYFKNQLLPQLDMNFRLWFPGQSGERTLFQDNNPLTGNIIGKIVGSRWDSFRESWDRKYQNWEISLSLNIPFADIFKRSDLIKARLEKEKSELEMEKLKNEIENELIQVYKELENRSKRIRSTARYRIMTEKQLDAALQRYELGLETSSQWLLEYQRRQATARVDEIKAITDYNIALAKLDRIMGTNIESHDLHHRRF